MQDGLDAPSARRVRWTLIATTDRSRLLGIVEAVGLRLPWCMSDEVSGLRRVTGTCPMVMGRRTFISLGGPLPGRLNVVLTRRRDFAPEGVVVAHDAAAVRQALHRDGACGPADAFLVGGAVVFGQFLPDARQLCMTEAGRTFDGNCIFARFTRGGSRRVGWRQAGRERRFLDQGFEYSFVRYERRRAEEAQGSRAPAYPPAAVRSA